MEVKIFAREIMSRDNYFSLENTFLSTKRENESFMMMECKKEVSRINTIFISGYLNINSNKRGRKE